jgi:hypothetical protein
MESIMRNTSKPPASRFYYSPSEPDKAEGVKQFPLSYEFCMKNQLSTVFILFLALKVGHGSQAV